MAEMIDTILTKKVNNVIYELMVKTSTHMVYSEDGYTLTEMLNDVVSDIAGVTNKINNTNSSLSKVASQITGMAEQIEDLQMYYQNQDNALTQISESLKKDFVTYEDLPKDTIDAINDMYTKAEIDKMVDEINTSIENLKKEYDTPICVGDDEVPPDELKEGGIYFQRRL